MALKDLAPPVRPKATLVYSPHPLLVDAGRVVQQTVTVRGEKLGGYLRRHGIDTDKPLVVTVDGKPVARDEWELLDPESGQLVAARGAVAGGGDGGGSQVVAMVAMIALAVFAPYLAGAAYGMMTSGTALTMAQASVWAANSAIGMVMTGAVTMAGSMLINKLMPAPKMDLGKGLGALQASANYSITGGQNRARPFEPLALVLGTHRVFFDLAGRPYSTYQGEDQYLYQVFCVGLVGPHGALDVSDLRIGTTLLSTYEGVTTETSIGTMPAMMPANVDTIAGASISAADPQTVRTTSPNTTKIELDFTAMAYRARSDGDIEGALLDWTIEYCAAGTGAWQTLEYVSTYGNGQKPIRLSRSYAVSSGTYDVRVTGHTLSTSSKFIRQLTWDAVKCYQPDDGYYEGQQFLAVKIKATGQLTGVIDRLNGIVRMPTAPGVYSSNPADLFKLFAIGHKAADGRPLWGGQLSSGAIDTAGLDAWKTWCTAKGLTFNAVLDSQRSVWDALQAISRCGRGSPTWAPGKLGVVWDADNQPVVANFGMSNIKRGSFEVAYQSEAPVEEVVLTYVNAADDYAADTVRALAPGVTSPTKSATIELWGCTDQAMAVKECHLALAENLYRTRLVSWETDMEGLVVTRGDVVSLSHDLTQWGKSGRLVAGTTTEITLDQAIPLESAGTWIGIIAPNGTQYTCRVAYQAGEHSEITLLDPLPIAPSTDSPVDWRYTADYVATPGKLVKIVSLVPSGMESVRLTAVDEYDEFYAAENGTYTPPTRRQWLSNQPQIRALGVSEEIVKSGGSHSTKLIISWTEAGNVASRLVRYSLDGGPLEIAGYANGSRFELIVPDAGTVMIVVTLYDGAGQTSSGAQASVTHTLQGLAYAPFDLASFAAVGGLFQVRLSWVFQGDINDAKFVEVWGGNTNNRANATLLTVQAVPANGWLHTGLQTGQTWFYWARVIDHKNRPSDFLPLSATAGTSATTSSDPSDLLDALTGAITEDALYIDLASRIDQIDAPTTGALAQISAVQAQVNSLQAEIADISGTEAYDPLVTYQAEDLVTYDGGLYRAIQATTGNAPTNTTYWTKIGDYASLGEAVSGLSVAVDDLDTRVTATESGLSSEVTARSTLATQLRGSYTGTNVASVTSGLIYSERQARSTADASEVTARQALATKMTGAADPSSLTLATLSAGLLYDERQARSTADATEVTARQALSAKMTGFSDPSGKVLADLTSGLIFEEKTARVSAVSAVASDVSTLEAQVDSNSAAITAEQTARADADSALSSSVSTLTAKVANNAAGNVFVETWAGANALGSWANVTGSGELSVLTTSESTVGGKILRVGNNSGNDQAWMIHDDLIAFDPEATYRIEVRVRRTAGSGLFYAGWQGIAADGVTRVNTAGLDSNSSQHYHGGSGKNPGETFETFVGYTRGHGETSGSGAGTLASPGVMHPNVRYLKPMFIANYSGQTGVMEIDSFVVTRGEIDAANAAIQSEQTARADADSALASDITTLETTVSGHTTSIQTNATSIDGIEAKYTVKIDNNGYVSGYGLISTANNGTPTSSFIILADKFQVVTPGKAAKVPFVVGTVNGTSAVGIDGTLVVDGSLVAQKIDTRGLTVKDAAGNVILSSGVPLDWARVGGTNKPADGATVGAPAGTLVNGVPVATITTAVSNFNASNDRNSAAVTAPTIATTGTAVDHTIQTDGSADISFEWSWSGADGDIDGFLVYVRQSSSSSAYTFGTTPAEETVYTVPAAKRAFILFGTAANRYYTFGVQAYRSVDKDINSAGVIKSTLVKATGSGENPYRPSSTVAFAGNVTGTIDGIATADINQWDKISGTGKPEDGATAGATWGSNIGGQPADAALLNAKLVARPNLVRGLKSWTMGGSNWVYAESPLTEDRTTLVIPSGSNGVASSSPTMALGSGQFTVSFRAWSSVAGRVLYVDLFPDTLPQSSATLTTSATDYSFTWSSSHADMASCALRFFADVQAGQIEIGNIKIETGAERSVWVPHTLDTVGINNRLTASNASTYIADAAIGKLQVDLASANRLTVGTANIDNLAVNTLQLAGYAVTAPVSGDYSGAAYGPANTTYADRTVTLGSITTDPYGRGEVVLLVNSEGQYTMYGSVTSGDTSALYLYVWVQLLRNGAVIWERVNSALTNTSITEATMRRQFLDTPGAGVTATYQLRVITQSSGTSSHSITIPSGGFTFFEFKR